MNAKIIVIAAGSALVGAAAGVLGTMRYFKKKYEQVAQNEIDEVRKYYSMNSVYQAEKSNEEALEAPSDTEIESEEASMTDEERAEIKKKLKDNWKQTTNYAACYNRQTTGPEEEEPEDEGGPVLTEEEWTDRMKNISRPPKLISADDLEGLPNYVEMETWFYYTYDATVTDENDQVIEDYMRYLGDCLDKYDFPDSDETVIYVRNFEYDKVYEITKINANYVIDKMYQEMGLGDE